MAHDAGRGHPERPDRLISIAKGISDVACDVGHEAMVALQPRLATRAELARVHQHRYLDSLEIQCATARALDADTVVGPGTYEAALLAAGSGLGAIEVLEGGTATAAFLAVRPPGHHARADRAMGFCVLNNIAVSAAALVAQGERVLIVDFDAHHGNGTQEIFWDTAEVLYVSLHQWPCYPGTGAIDEIGAGLGHATTCNVPLPPGATGDVYQAAFDVVIDPLVEQFGPTWVLISAGFDAHRDDPLTSLGLSAADFGILTSRVMQFPPSSGRAIFFLEGGYDLAALRQSVGATCRAILGTSPSNALDAPTANGPGMDAVESARSFWADL